MRWKGEPIHPGDTLSLYSRYVKRALDIGAAVIVMPFFALLCVVLVPLIRFSDGGPAFYVAKRLGKNGAVFDMYKFRSMVVNAPDVRLKDGSTYNASDDPRLTSIGRLLRKTSLDEVPQLLNVLKGDMSIIGPRPDLPEQKELYGIADMEKLTVRPGITGYSQAYYRNSIAWKERLKLDAQYAKQVSFAMDMKILLKTLSSVLTGSHVYVQEQGQPAIDSKPTENNQGMQ